MATYIPHRLDEGYGLNCQAIERIAADGTRLLVTLDCGITSHRGDRPGATSWGWTWWWWTTTRCPRRCRRRWRCSTRTSRAASYPTKHLCAAGVAFNLCMGLRKRLREDGLLRHARGAQPQGAAGPGGAGHRGGRGAAHRRQPHPRAARARGADARRSGPGVRALKEVAGLDAGRAGHRRAGGLPARAPHQRRGPAGRRVPGPAAAAARDARGGAAAGAGAGRGQRRAAGHRAATSSQGRWRRREARRGVARLGALLGGLAPGRDRHRRLAGGGAVPPAHRDGRREGRGGAGLGAQHRGLPPLRRAQRRAPSTWRASAGTSTPPASPSSAEHLPAFREAFERDGRRAAHATRTWCPAAGWTRWWRPSELDERAVEALQRAGALRARATPSRCSRSRRLVARPRVLQQQAGGGAGHLKLALEDAPAAGRHRLRDGGPAGLTEGPVDLAFQARLRRVAGPPRVASAQGRARSGLTAVSGCPLVERWRPTQSPSARGPASSARRRLARSFSRKRSACGARRRGGTAPSRRSTAPLVLRRRPPLRLPTTFRTPGPIPVPSARPSFTPPPPGPTPPTGGDNSRDRASPNSPGTVQRMGGTAGPLGG